MVGNERIVSDEDDRLALLVVQALEQTDDLCPGLAIQVASWLIRQQDSRVVNQCAGDCHTLLLSAGELVRAVVHAVAQTDQFQGSTRFLSARAYTGTIVKQRQHDIIECGGARQ